jgi:hypothetical protein
MEDNKAYCVRIGKDHMLGMHYRVFLNVEPTGRMVDFHIDDEGNKSSVLLWLDCNAGKFYVKSSDENNCGVTEAKDFIQANKLFHKYLNDNFTYPA